MIRDANLEDYYEICSICSSELGYICEPMLVRYRLETLDKSRIPEKMRTISIELLDM